MQKEPQVTWGQVTIVLVAAAIVGLVIGLLMV
jgi:hypothetical protein